MESRSESQTIPFTIHFPNVLNQLILSYLSVGELEKLEQTEATHFEQQVFIQKLVTPQITALANDLRPNLVQLLQKIPDAKIEIAENNEDAYRALCHMNKALLSQTITQAFDPDTQLTAEYQALIQDCIMHYCYCFPYEAGILLNHHIGKTNKPILTEFLIDHGANITAREEKLENDSTLRNAIKCKAPSSQIIKLIRNRNIHSKDKKHYGSNSTMCIAAFLCKIETLYELAKVLPEVVLVSLADLDDILSERVPYIDYKFDDVTYSFGHEAIEKAKTKLLLVSDQNTKSHINNKNYIIKVLEDELTAIEDMQSCFKIYDILINNYYLNYRRNYITDSYIVPLFFSPSSYTNTKQRCIEMIREKIYNIAASIQFINSFRTSFVYYEECKNLLKHSVFSDEHDKNGVDTKFKDLLKSRINEIATSLAIKHSYSTPRS